MKKIMPLLSLLFLLTSCSPNNPYEGKFSNEINILTSEDESKVVEQIISEYNSNHSEKIKYSLTKVKSDEKDVDKHFDLNSFSLIYTYPSSYSAIDVSKYEPVSNDYVRDIKNNYPLASYDVDPSSDEIKIFPTELVSNYYLYYDTRYIKEESKSLESVLNKAKSLNKEVIIPFLNSNFINSFFMSKDTCGMDSMSYQISKEGNAIYNTNWDNENGVKLASYLSSTINPLYNDGTLSVSSQMIIDESSKDRCIAYIGGAHMYEYVKNIHKDFSITKLPSFSFDGKEAQMSSFSYSKGYVVNKNKTAEEIESAMALASLLTNEESQLKRFEILGVTPTNKQALKSKRYISKANELNKAIELQQEYSVSTDKSVEERYWNVGKDIATHIFLNDIEDWNYYLKTQMDSLRN